MRDLSRRSFLGLGLGLGLGGGALIAACGDNIARATPNIPDDDDMPACRAAATAPNIEGPFYKKGAPHRSVLVVPDDPGERLLLTGTVRSTRCAAVAGATLDIWQANAAGAYDLDGYRFRGALVTDRAGRWELRSIVPGRYLNGDRYRPAHIHVKLRAAGHAPLTTQLYFAGDPYNDGDPFIDPSLIMQHTLKDKLRRASFDFVMSAT